MAQLTRHQLGASLLAALRQEGLGVRDLFEGRQEPLTWYFRAVAFDQSELDIMESGAVEVLHAPSALVELAVDEMALACANIGREGIASYLEWAPPAPDEVGAPVEAEEIRFDPVILLGYLNLDVAPPALWLDGLEADSDVTERLAGALSEMARDTGAGCDAVEVHIEGALDPEGAWSEAGTEVRPAGVSVHFTVDLPLADAGERALSRHFVQGAGVAARALERMREVFRRV